MRSARDRDTAPAAVSHTPIYDTLYSEYLRAFRALPGDRTGEEDLGFTAFSYGGAYGGAAGIAPSHGSGAYGSGWSGSGGSGSLGSGSSPWQPEPWQPAYAPVPQPSYAYAGSTTNGRQHQTGMQHIPAALPPAPRRGY
ncbi:hypothetical protein ABZ128_19580 [Streptomyces sp. NPDC006326]|uniref:hypothetical protein n=1 Tax=Streptomyces sp. NPDC006326 TaxID=3156752 RepID=UPI0033ABB59E